MPPADFTRCTKPSADRCMQSYRCMRWTAVQTEGRDYSHMSFHPVTKPGEFCDGFICSVTVNQIVNPSDLSLEGDLR